MEQEERRGKFKKWPDLKGGLLTLWIGISDEIEVGMIAINEKVILKIFVTLYALFREKQVHWDKFIFLSILH